MGEVILVASGKGGVGKTSFVANGGVVLSQMGYKVLLIDMNMGLRNLDIYLGIESKVVYDIADVLTGMCRVRQATVKDRKFPNLFMISAAQYKDKADITPLHMKVFCEKLKPNYDYILVDAPAGVDNGLTMAAAGADKAVIITVPENAAVRDADMLDRILGGLGIDKRTYVVNKVRENLLGAAFLPSLEQISEVIRSRPSGFIQYDENLHIAANTGIPVVSKGESYLKENFTNIIKRIICM